jgi:hypothetical protein
MLRPIEQMVVGTWTQWDCAADCGAGKATRTRDCNNVSANPDPNCEEECEDALLDEKDCYAGCCEENSECHYQEYYQNHDAAIFVQST